MLFPHRPAEWSEPELHKLLATAEYRAEKTMMDKAIKLHEYTGASVAITSRVTSIQYDVLWRAIRARRQGRPIQRVGRPTHLNEEAELELIEELKEKRAKHEYVSLSSLVKPAQKIQQKHHTEGFRSPTIKKSYIRSLAIRSPRLSTSRPIQMEPSRIDALVPINIIVWIRFIKTRMEQYKITPNKLFNWDETSLRLSDSLSMHCVHFVNLPSAIVKKGKRVENATLLCTAAADGTRLCAHILYPKKNEAQEFMSLKNCRQWHRKFGEEGSECPTYPGDENVDENDPTATHRAEQLSFQPPPEQPPVPAQDHIIRPQKRHQSTRPESNSGSHHQRNAPRLKQTTLPLQFGSPPDQDPF
ncbi:hypothetical protein BLNAU_5081 [Blattamonas nauphoetae]|uniref:Transposase n=1 Tax=Blattamonas nauphoetae TaxID=2049346 RepID=A0ABQ9Y883_9EUKA|nr:hypothetical protein BLNAU_5081 [Blattamonas nauphoetae]